MHWTETFFGKYYLPTHMPVLKDEKTLAEVNFMESCLGLEKGSNILDIPCGHGRHSITLAERGYNVTGIDFQKDFIQLAKENSKHLSNIEFIVSDMRTIDYENKFDGIINFFTSFGYFSEEENVEVMKKFSKALKKGGKILIETVNREWAVKNIGEIKQSWMLYPDNENITFIANNVFDILTGRMISRQAIINKDERYLQDQDIRLYAYTEMKDILDRSGLKILECFGDISKDSYDEDSSSMIIIAEKI